ncbi:MAG: adenylosuccinate lyase [Proteobacteria bacterium]|nr:adenylosuccinate lyase [Pseudomonadota bacterium]
MMKHAFAALIALAASVAPGFAAGDCNGRDKQASMSCAEGTSWDAATRTCIKLES